MKWFLSFIYLALGTRKETLICRVMAAVYMTLLIAWWCYRMCKNTEIVNERHSQTEGW